jgi:hypothetical protein
MYIYMYACIYVLFIYLNTDVYMCVCAYIFYTYIYIYIYIYINIYINMFIQRSQNILTKGVTVEPGVRGRVQKKGIHYLYAYLLCRYKWMNMYLCVYIYVYVSIYMYIYIFIYIYIYTMEPGVRGRV